MKILHLSDTHYTRDIDDPELKPVLDAQVPLEKKFNQILEQENLDTFDLVMVTGDIVHEGTLEDYRTIKNLIERTFSPLPIYFCLGNHDRKPVFYEGMTGESKDANYDYDFEMDHFHIIVLDTAKNYSHSGILDSTQIEWLERTMAKNNHKKLIFQHHPIIGGIYFDQFTMEEPDEVLHLLNNSNVIGVFTGHTHSPAINIYQDLKQYTTYAVSFGLEKVKDGTQHFTDTCGYSVIEYRDDSGLTVAPRIIQPVYKILKTTNPNQMKELNSTYEFED